MKCPSCGYENKPDALTCNLCQHILRREKTSPAAPRPVAPPVTEAAPAQPIARAPRGPFPLKLIFFGLLLTVLGTFLSCRQYRRASLPNQPRVMSKQEMLDHSGFAFTRYERGELLRDAPLYHSNHVFHAVDPRVGFEAANAKDLLAARKKVVGTFVRLADSGPFLSYYTLQTKKITYGKVTEEQILGYRIFAPVLAGNGSLWIASPSYATEPKGEHFAPRAYQGTLIYLKSLFTEETYHKLERAYGTLIPNEAVVIVEGDAPTSERVTTWYPLGPTYDLFVAVPDDADVDLAYAEGILDEPLSDLDRKNLQTALDRTNKKISLPPRVRAIVITDPERFKADRRLGERFDRFYIGIAVTGLLLLALAAKWFVR
jgi:hypothetical protein